MPSVAPHGRAAALAALALTLLAPAARADLPPPKAPVTPPADAAVLLDNATLLDAWVSSGLTATSGERPIQIDAGRRDLDTGLVVTIVHARLRQVALRAASDLLRRLVGDARRAWARDLLGLTIKLTTSEPELQRAAAEAVVRLAIRAVLADAIVDTRLPAGTERAAHHWQPLGWTPAGSGVDADLRAHLDDWVYWRLSQHPLVADTVDRPGCGGQTDNALALCTRLTGLPPPAALAMVDELSGLRPMLDGIVLVARVRATLKDQPLAPRAIIRAFIDAGGLARFDRGALDLKRWRALVTALRNTNGELVTLQFHTDRLRKRTAALGVKLEALAADAAVGASPRELADELKQLQAILDTKIGARTVRALIIVAGGETMQAWLAEADRTFERVRTALTTGARLPEDELAALRRAFTTVQSLQSPDMGAVLLDLDAQVKELTDFLVEKLGAGLELEALATGDGAQLKRLLDRLATALDKARLQLGGYDPTLRAGLTDMLATVRRVAALVDKLTGFAALVSGTRLGDVTVALRALGVRDGAAVLTPLLDVLEPALDELADGRPITTPVLFRALAALGPTRVARALGLPDDLSQLCADGQPRWRCWSGRLALGVHDAVRVDGTSVEIDTSRLLERLARAGQEDRKHRPGAFYLHAAVGAGGLWLPQGVPPLFAEQLGVGMHVVGGERLSLRLAVFGSGLLYRIVVDSDVSDGLLVGGAVLVGLYDTVELYGAPVLTYRPADEGTAGRLELGLAFGVQVPLGDYLAELRD